VKKIGIPPKRRFLPLGGNHLFHSELAVGARQGKAKTAWSAREENRDSPQKVFFAFRGGNHLFHSELAVGARQGKAKTAWSAREENRDSPQKAFFAFRGESSFSQRASRWS
jgi:hypothetical protein